METIWMIQKAKSIGHWWLAASSWATYPLMHPVSCSFLGKTSNHPDDSVPCSPDLVPCHFWLFPNLKLLWKGRDFRLSMRFRKVWQGSWGLMGELYEVPRCLLWMGPEASLSYVQCFFFSFPPPGTIFLVFCIFVNKCLHFSYYMTGYLLDRPHICPKIWDTRTSPICRHCKLLLYGQLNVVCTLVGSSRD